MAALLLATLTPRNLIFQGLGRLTIFRGGPVL
jgi:hypothetical protein